MKKEAKAKLGWWTRLSSSRVTATSLLLFHQVRSLTMETNHLARVLKPSPSGIAEAGRVLASGGLCAFPTETVYGLGANALNETAVLRIFEAKRRPLSDPLIVHVKDAASASELVIFQDERRKTAFELLAGRFWPGPLTIVVDAAPQLPKCLMAGTSTIGVRCPSHPVARSLLESAGVPVAAPSANLFGHVSPTSASHVLDDLGDQPDLTVLDGGACCDHGIESTVCSIGPGQYVTVFRRGAVTRSQLEDALKEIDFHVKVVDNFSKTPPKSNDDAVGEVAPGQLLTHYAPRLPAFLTTIAAADSRENLSNAVVIDFGRRLAALEEKSLAYRDLSPEADAASAAATLFDTLRWAENVQGAERVLVVDLSDDRADKGMLAGVADRVYRAASGKTHAVGL